MEKVTLKKEMAWAFTCPACDLVTLIRDTEFSISFVACSNCEQLYISVEE